MIPATDIVACTSGADSIRADRAITRNELATWNRSTRFPASHVGGVLRTAPEAGRPATMRASGADRERAQNVTTHALEVGRATVRWELGNDHWPRPLISPTIRRTGRVAGRRHPPRSVSDPVCHRRRRHGRGGIAPVNARLERTVAITQYRTSRERISGRLTPRWAEADKSRARPIQR